MPATRRVYDEEFKKNAVKQSYTSQKTIAETAKELGVSMRALREWRQYYTAEGEKTSLALREEETEALLLDLAELRIPKLEDVINEVKWRILQKAYQE